MKKFLTLLLALAMTLSLAACGSDSTEETEGTDGTEAETVDYTAMSDDELKAAITTVSEGTLTVATSPDFAPMSSTPSARTARPLWLASRCPWRSTSPITWALSWKSSPWTLTAL